MGINKLAGEPNQIPSIDAASNRLVVARSWMNSLDAKRKLLGDVLSNDIPWRMLLQAYVAYREQEPVTATQLAEAGSASVSLATRYIALLESEGWLERCGRASGARVAHLQLTQQAVVDIEGLVDTIVLGNRRLGLAKALLDS